MQSLKKSKITLLINPKTKHLNPKQIQMFKNQIAKQNNPRILKNYTARTRGLSIGIITK